MDHDLLKKLEQKIETAIESIELLKLQIEELEEQKGKLACENLALKEKQTTWEQNLLAMIEKLSTASELDQNPKKTIVTFDEVS